MTECRYSSEISFQQVLDEDYQRAFNDSQSFVTWQEKDFLLRQYLLDNEEAGFEMLLDLLHSDKPKNFQRALRRFVIELGIQDEMRLRHWEYEITEFKDV